VLKTRMKKNKRSKNNASEKKERRGRGGEREEICASSRNVIQNIKLATTLSV
jgi:hypothetical protein